MSRNCFLLVIFLFFASITASAYRIDAGEYYVGGGFGVMVNVARFNVAPRITPSAELPLIVNLDYALDHSIGFFGSFVPRFSAGNLGFLFRGGAKYWFTQFDAPFIPYVSAALTPAFLFPTGEGPSHFSLGLAPGAGINFFVMAKLMVGAHIQFNPSIAFADGESKFEFSVMTFFDVSLRV